MCFILKAELTQILHSLSSKAKSTSDFVTKLKSLPNLIEENACKSKNALSAEIDEMIRNLEARKKDLADLIDAEKSARIKSVHDQMAYLSGRVNKTAGLLQYCVETLKEQDARSFLLISESMISRITDAERKFTQESDLKSRAIDIDFDFDMMLNSDITLIKEMRKLAYKQVKVPNSPSFLIEECVNSIETKSALTTSAADPVIVLSWHQKPNTSVMSGCSSSTNSSIGSTNKTTTSRGDLQGYVLEIDEGTPESGFKQVYCGPDSICQINGLEPNKVYSARVKAFNQVGCSEYSHVISIPSTPSMLIPTKILGLIYSY